MISQQKYNKINVTENVTNVTENVTENIKNVTENVTNVTENVENNNKSLVYHYYNKIFNSKLSKKYKI